MSMKNCKIINYCLNIMVNAISLAMETLKDMEGELLYFLTSAENGGEYLESRSGCFIPG